MNFLLIGPRGCGKSTVGSSAAAAEGLRFVDLDERVLGRFQEGEVSAVWRVHGEAAWRAAEVEELRDALRFRGQVLALGGGTPMIEAARAIIDEARRSGRARVVYLACRVDELRRRLGREPGDRPSLTGGDPVDEMATVLAEREPVYRQVADVVLECPEESVPTTVDRLRRALKPR